MYQTVWKVSGQFGKFLNSLENIRTVLKSFQTVPIISCYMSHGKHGILRNLFMHFWRIFVRENDFCAL